MTRDSEAGWGRAFPAGPGARRSAMSNGTTIRVPAGGDALAKAIEAAAPRDTLVLEPGEHAGDVAISVPLTLVGEAGAAATIVRGGGRGSVLRIEEDGIAVALQGLTLTGGVAAEGGAVALRGQSGLHLRGCVVAGNRAGYHGGGGIAARLGTLTVEDTTFEGNAGRQGGAVLLDRTVRATFRRCAFVGNEGELGGAVRAAERAFGLFEECTFRGNRSESPGSNVYITATSTNVPEVTLAGCRVADGSFYNSGAHAGRLAVRGCELPVATRATDGLTDGGGNTWKEDGSWS